MGGRGATKYVRGHDQYVPAKLRPNGLLLDCY